MCYLAYSSAKSTYFVANKHKPRGCADTMLLPRSRGASPPLCLSSFYPSSPVSPIGCSDLHATSYTRVGCKATKGGSVLGERSDFAQILWVVRPCLWLALEIDEQLLLALVSCFFGAPFRAAAAAVEKKMYNPCPNSSAPAAVLV